MFDMIYKQWKTYELKKPLIESFSYYTPTKLIDMEIINILNKLDESHGIIEYSDKIEELLKIESHKIFQTILKIRNIGYENVVYLKNSYGLDDEPFELYNINFYLGFWLQQLNILLSDQIYEYFNSFVIDNTNGLNTTLNDKPIIDIINKDNVKIGTIVIDFSDVINENQIYTVLKHELKHIFKRLKTGYYNDRLYADQINGAKNYNKNEDLLRTYIEYNSIGELIGVKSDEETKTLIEKNNDPKWIYDFIYKHAYDLNDVEIQAKLENYNIILNKTDQLVLSIYYKKLGYIGAICKISQEAEHYYTLYNTICYIRDHYCKDIDDCDKNQYKFKELYNKNFNTLYDLLDFFANEKIYKLFIRHAMTLYQEKINKK